MSLYRCIGSNGGGGYLGICTSTNSSGSVVATGAITPIVDYGGLIDNIDYEIPWRSIAYTATQTITVTKACRIAVIASNSARSTDTITITANGETLPTATISGLGGKDYVASFDARVGVNTVDITATYAAISSITFIAY